MMRMCLIALVGLGLWGCEQPSERMSAGEEAAGNRWIVQGYADEQIARAVIAQHTLYSYHFEPGSAALNPLGERDVAVLAEHFERTPGTLNIRRGPTPEGLYEARVAAVTGRLADAGVTPDAVEMADGHPGGEGLPGEQALVILGSDIARPLRPSHAGRARDYDDRPAAALIQEVD